MLRDQELSGATDNVANLQPVVAPEFFIGMRVDMLCVHAHNNDKLDFFCGV